MGKRALVVGCGLGYDAEFLARLGYAVTGFDVAPTAIERAVRENPGSAAASSSRRVARSARSTSSSSRMTRTRRSSAGVPSSAAVSAYFR
jgi:protein-L-isoaspartate O-methyltransferase